MTWGKSLRARHATPRLGKEEMLGLEKKDASVIALFETRVCVEVRVRCLHHTHTVKKGEGMVMAGFSKKILESF